MSTKSQFRDGSQPRIHFQKSQKYSLNRKALATLLPLFFIVCAFATRLRICYSFATYFL